MTNEPAGEGLKRVIGTSSFAATVINNTIGAGIFALPAIVGMQMGISGITAYVFCGCMMAAVMLCYAEIASRVNTSGGSYAYVEAAFGPFAGFLINALFLFGCGIVGSAAIMNLIPDTLSVFFPAFSNPLVRALFFVLILGFMALLNVRGAKQGVRFVEFLTIAKVAPLLWIIIFGISHIQTSNLHWEQSAVMKSLGDTSIILFFAFMGFETSMNSSGEIKNPKRTIPLGFLTAGGLLLLIYILLQTVTQGILGSQIGQFKDAPLAAVAERLAGPVGARIILAATIISVLGNVSGDVLATPRLLFAGAQKGLFPKFLGKVHPRFSTPYWAVLIYSLLIFIFSITGGFRQLAMLASGTMLIIYLSVILAMLKLRIKKQESGEQGFKVPGGLLIPCMAIAAIVWLFWHLSANELLSLLAAITILCVIYAGMKFFESRRKPITEPSIDPADKVIPS